MKTNVEKVWLLGVLGKNRTGHREEFEKAFVAFKAKALEQMQRNLAAAKEGKGVRLFVKMTEPRDMTAAYDRVIGMLAQSTSDTIELNEQDWQQYVQDEWDWTNQFKSSTQPYLGNNE